MMDAGLSRPPTEMETLVNVFVFYFLPCKDRRPAEDTPAEGAGPLFLLLEIVHFFLLHRARNNLICCPDFFLFDLNVKIIRDVNIENKNTSTKLLVFCGICFSLFSVDLYTSLSHFCSSSLTNEPI